MTNIPHQALVLVGDGRKALFLRNTGDEVYPDLRVAQVLEDAHQPHTAELGTDRPGRVRDHASGRRSAVEQTDWHELAEHAFAREVAAKLEQGVAKGEIDKLILVVPPKTLADLRNALSSHVKDRVVAEIAKDLTKHPVPAIERLLIDA